jgi:hypothetical protein
MLKNIAVTTVLAAALCAAPAMAGDGGSFKALQKVAGVTAMSNHELSKVEGGVIQFGNYPITLNTPDLNSYLNEVLLTQLGVGGRTPLVVRSYLDVDVSVSENPLPWGGLGIGINLVPVHQILTKSFRCGGAGCTP